MILAKRLFLLRPYLWDDVIPVIAVAFAVITGLIITSQAIITIVVVFAVVVYVVLAVLSPSAALVMVLAIAPLRTLIETEAEFVFPVDVGQLSLVGLLIILFFVRLCQRGRILQETRITLVHIALVVFLLITALSLPNAVMPSAWLNEWVKWLQILLLVLIVPSLATSGTWRWLQLGFLVVAASHAVVGIYQFFGGSGALHLVINDRFFRAFGTFGQPNPFGGFMGLAFAVALSRLLGELTCFYEDFSRLPNKTRLKRLLPILLMLVLSLLFALALVMSWSRGALIGFVVAACFVMLFAFRRVGLGLLAVLSVTSLVIALWLFGLLPESLFDRLRSSLDYYLVVQEVRGIDITPENYAVIERLAHWQAAIDMFHSSPWLGVGFGNYEFVYECFRLLNWPEPLGHAHNYYLNLLAEVGVLGLLGFLKVMLAMFILFVQALRHPDALSRMLVVGVVGALVYLLVHSFFDNLFVNNLFLHIGFLLGLLLAIHREASVFVKVAHP